MAGSSVCHSRHACFAPRSPADPVLSPQLSESIFQAIAGGMIPFTPGAMERGIRPDDEVSLLVRTAHLSRRAGHSTSGLQCAGRSPGAEQLPTPYNLCAPTSMQAWLEWVVALALMMAATPQLRGSGELVQDIFSAAGEVLLATMSKRVSGLWASRPCCLGS